MSKRVRVTPTSRIGYGTKAQREAAPVSVRRMSAEQVTAMRQAAPQVRRRAIVGVNVGGF